MWTIEIALDDGTVERFVVGGGQADYELVDVVEGRSSGPPAYGVYARWVLDDSASARAFEDSRRTLFDLRKTNIDSFVCDLLIRPIDSDLTEYVVVGIYSDADGLGLARSHPAIADWAQGHPPESFSARDVTGMRTGRVVDWQQT